MMKPHNPIELHLVEQAQQRIGEYALRTPLVRLDGGDDRREIYLKLENLQPTNSFKIRGACNAIAIADPAVVKQGVWTASAGNMAQAVGWHARKRQIKCTAFVPEFTAQTKLDRLVALGCLVEKIPFEQWVGIILNHGLDSMDGLFVHPVSDVGVMAGNGTVGLEILEDLPDVDTIVVPYGLGGLACGIGSLIAAKQPTTRVLACETDAAAPFSASLKAGHRVNVDYNPSFADAMGAPMVLETMWPLAQQVLSGSVVVPLSEVAAAVKLLAEQLRIIAEGSGAAALAAALSGQAGNGKIVCVVSGGNIDNQRLIATLNGQVPE